MQTILALFVFVPLFLVIVVLNAASFFIDRKQRAKTDQLKKLYSSVIGDDPSKGDDQ